MSATSAAVTGNDHIVGPVPYLLCCPGCGAAAGAMEEIPPEGRACRDCPVVLSLRDGILRALPRRADYESFLRDYGAVRKAEGRGSHHRDYYLALPFRDVTGRHADQWSIRGKTYRYFERRILPGLSNGNALDVLDLGAGNCWMSYRLALRSHQPVAVDIFTDENDGLGAARHYQAELGRPFPLIEAEFDRLPLAGGQFDLAVFNSSFHYSTDYERTLSEVRRCLRKTGSVVILDSPVYREREHGQRMIEERHRSFERLYGFRSDSVPSIEFLDENQLEELSVRQGMEWSIFKPWYGWRWHSRPWKAMLRRSRPPSRFWILTGRWRRA